MKFTITRDNLKQATMKVISAISTRITLPVMQNILVEAEGDAVTLTASDLEITISATVPALIFEPGATTVPAQKLAKIASDLPAGDVTAENEKDSELKIASGRVVFRLHCISAESYQKPEDFEEDWAFTMPAQELNRCIAKVAYAISDDSHRPALTGIYIASKDGGLTIVATDGRRLALVERPQNVTVQTDGDLIMPGRLTSILKGLDSGDCQIRANSTYVSFVTSDTTINSKLIAGNYPNYRQVIPSTFANEVQIPRADISAALKRISIMIPQDQDNSSFKLTLEPGILTIFAQSQEYGDATENIDLDYHGEPFTVCFAPNLFNDPLKALEANNLSMSFTDDLSPVRISGDIGFTYILMPIRN